MRQEQDGRVPQAEPGSRASTEPATSCTGNGPHIVYGGLGPSGFDPSRGAFTPGPWRWVAEDCSMCTLESAAPDEHGFQRHVVSVTICENCQSHVADQGRWEWGRCYTANEADAALIAAAPVLFAALELMQFHASRCSGFADDDERWAAFSQAVRALAMARGQWPPRDRDRSAEGGQTAEQAGPKARARAEGIAQNPTAQP